MGAFDAHYGAIGAGARTGTLVKIIGTSTCDCAVTPVAGGIQNVPGICGIVNGSIMPGYFGIEAGQSAVGDLLAWWVERVCEGDDALHAELTARASRLRPGESGLVALDWNNGNRTILVDPRLTGLIVGQTLHTTRADVYRALIEATAFGARAIVERLKAFGVPVERVVCCGGIAEKNQLFMQIYADVLGLSDDHRRVAADAGARRGGVCGRGGRCRRWRACDVRGGPDGDGARRRHGVRAGPGRQEDVPTNSTGSTWSCTTRSAACPVEPADLGTAMKRLLAIRDRVSAI